MKLIINLKLIDIAIENYLLRRIVLKKEDDETDSAMSRGKMIASSTLGIIR